MGMVNDSQRPLIVVTNDDGVDSPGLLAIVAAMCDIADIVVSAPLEQSSGAGTSKPPLSSCRIIAKPKQVNGQEMTFYGVEGSPLQSVQHGAIELAPRTPDLVISGINYGENIGASIIVSGTLGAAMEAAVMGIPALAVSLECPPEYVYVHGDLDFSVAAYFTRKFALQMLANKLPPGVDLLNINVPKDATSETLWKPTIISKYKRYALVPPHRRQLSDPGQLQGLPIDVTFEPNSDIHTLYKERLVSVTPLRVNATANIDIELLRSILLTEVAAN
jgi:5'-nucleotidase